jgi:mRNA-degrading endonuclease RelE of RelBE toxin-antitoxin system
VAYRIALSEYARHQLSQLPPATLDTILDCLNEIQADPFRDLHLRVVLVLPRQRIYRDSYLCGNWAIAYDVQPDQQVLVAAVSDTFYRP